MGVVFFVVIVMFQAFACGVQVGLWLARRNGGAQ